MIVDIMYDMIEMRRNSNRKAFLLTLSTKERQLLKLVAQEWGVTMSSAIRRLIQDRAIELEKRQ